MLTFHMLSLRCFFPFSDQQPEWSWIFELMRKHRTIARYQDKSGRIRCENERVLTLQKYSKRYRISTEMWTGITFQRLHRIFIDMKLGIRIMFSLHCGLIHKRITNYFHFVLSQWWIKLNGLKGNWDAVALDRGPWPSAFSSAPPTGPDWSTKSCSTKIQPT